MTTMSDVMVMSWWCHTASAVCLCFLIISINPAVRLTFIQNAAADVAVIISFKGTCDVFPYFQSYIDIYVWMSQCRMFMLKVVDVSYNEVTYVSIITVSRKQQLWSERSVSNSFFYFQSKSTSAVDRFIHSSLMKLSESRESLFFRCHTRKHSHSH